MTARLLQHGANPEVRNRAGKFPVDLIPIDDYETQQLFRKFNAVFHKGKKVVKHVAKQNAA